MLLKILYSVRGDAFALLWEFGLKFQKYVNNRQKKKIFMIVTCADLVLSKKALTQEKVDFYSRKSLWNHFLVMRIYSKNAYKSSVSAAYQGLKRFFRQMGLIMLSVAKHAHNFFWLELDPFFNKTARAIIKASPVRGMSKVVSHLSIYFFYSHQTRSMQHVY